MSTRKHWSTKARLAVFTAHNGKCHLCGGRIQASVEGWDLSHQIPLELGGADDDSNVAPAHRTCHRAHTAAVDQPAIAKAKRNEARHIGARRSRTPLPCGRDSPFKKTMSGKVIRRTS